MSEPADDHPRDAPVLTARAVGITVLAWLAVAVCVVLGVWQWDRGNVVVSDPPAQRPVVDVSQVVTAGADEGEVSDASGGGVLTRDEVGQTVEVRGTFDPSVDLLVPDRTVADRRGSWVLGVVRLADGSGVPVVRGWVPAGGTAPAAPSGPVDLRGAVQPPEGSDVASSAALPAGQVAFVSAADLVNRVDYPLVNAYVTDAAPPAGLVAVPAGDPGEASRRLDWRNLAYAAQWWVFAGFAVAVWVRALRDDRRERRGILDGELGGELGGEPDGEPAGDDGPGDGPDGPTGQDRDPHELGRTPNGPGGRDMSGTR